MSSAKTTEPASTSGPTTTPVSGIRDNYHRGSVAEFLSDKIRDGSELSVVSAYFTIYAWDAFQHELSKVTQQLIDAIEKIRVLDPACGSGAFPMGVLHRLVHMLAKLDPKNRKWKEQQRKRALRDLARADEMEDPEIRETAKKNVEARLEDIEHSFNEDHHDLDFGRKLSHPSPTRKRCGLLPRSRGPPFGDKRRGRRRNIYEERIRVETQEVLR